MHALTTFFSTFEYKNFRVNQLFGNACVQSRRLALWHLFTLPQLGKGDTKDQLNLISVLKEALESNLSTDHWQQKFISLGETDDLTGLPNRRGFFAQSQRLKEMARRGEA